MLFKIRFSTTYKMKTLKNTGQPTEIKDDCCSRSKYHFLSDTDIYIRLNTCLSKNAFSNRRRKKEEAAARKTHE